MTSQRTDSLAYRAAQYVGMEDEPRRSVSLRPGVVLVVWNSGYGLIYREEHHRKSGEWFRLTPRRLAAIRSIFEDLDSRDFA